MFKLLLASIVFVPVILGMQAAARCRSARHGLVVLLSLVLSYSIFYVLLLYYIRIRWVG